MRPLVVKVHIYRPGGGRSYGLPAACGHLRYMNSPKKEELVTDAASMREQLQDEAAIHAKYMDERPGSQGLFATDPDHPPDQATLQREIAKHQGPVWRLFVSVHEDDAREMGGALMRRQSWEDACRVVLPKMAEEMGIPAGQIRWAAAMHRKEGHPHIHLLIWSQDPGKGFLGRDGLDKSKRAWVSALYAPERERLGEEKSALRAAIGEEFREALGRTTTDEFARRLTGIAASLPGQGRLAYGYMPASVKRQVDEAVDHLLRASPELRAMADRFADIAAEMAKHYSYKAERHEAAREKAMADLRQRLGGALLRAAVAMDERTAWQSVANEVAHAAMGRSEASPTLTAFVREEVSRLAQDPSEKAALDAARRLLTSHEMAERVRDLLENAARRGPADGAAERAARARERLEATVAGRLLGSAEYVRDARRFSVGQMYSGIGRALAATIQQAERDARLAEAQALEEEAQRRRQAAAQLGG